MLNLLLPLIQGNPFKTIIMKSHYNHNKLSHDKKIGKNTEEGLKYERPLQNHAGDVAELILVP